MRTARLPSQMTRAPALASIAPAEPLCHSEQRNIPVHDRNTICGERSLVFSDCESYELELLDPAKVPALKNADIIVELHDFMRIDVAITPTILARFAATHDIEITGVKRRSAQDFPCLSVLPREVRARALHEDRVQYQQWAYLKAKNW